jgi:hypothetical protein
VRLGRGLAWAASNIYYDGSKLTFKEYNYPCDNGEDMYQGVFFRWGSLVGLDPGTGLVSSLLSAIWNDNNMIYSPIYDSGTPTNSTWTPETGKVWNDADMPYVTGGTGDASTDNLASESTPANYAARKGDICRYLTATGAVQGSYRMPVLNELRYGHRDGVDSRTIEWDYTVWSDGTPTNGYWAMIGTVEEWGAYGTGITFTLNPNGTYVFHTGANYSDYTKFPMSGWMENTGEDGSLGHMGNNGRYWSGSAVSIVGSAGNISFTQYGITLTSDSRGHAYSVRCLLDE